MNVLQSITNCSNNSEYDNNILVCNPRSCNFKCSSVINLNRQNEISQHFRVMNDIQKKMLKEKRKQILMDGILNGIIH
jgi:hypothetical protein